jgi:hypothetical protein
MALATLDNVTALVGERCLNLSLGIEGDGLVAGTYGKLPFASAHAVQSAA